MRYFPAVVLGIAVCTVLACAPAEPAFDPEIPELPTMPVGLDDNYLVVPDDNPMTPEKVALGWQLYYDARLSADGTVSCASCHDPAAGFADPRRVSTGVGGLQGGRNSPTVINAAFNAQQFWDGRAATLEEQALGPIENPVEMATTVDAVVETLEGIPGYRQQFAEVFGGDQITGDMVAKAIASFERTVISGNAPWDQWTETRDPSVISEAALRGEELFRGKAGCSQCHLGFNFSDSHLGLYHNIGVGMTMEEFDHGRYGVTEIVANQGAFKTPTLRNVTETAPYMHDGSLATLEEVVDYYAQGGEPNAWLDPKISPLELTDHEKADLIAFLDSLTGQVPEFTRRAPALPPSPEGSQ
ncbi:MAG: cytochrome c peroxidase [Acidobacteriota bacterium]|jgi:cytochrome c peroxidase